MIVMACILGAIAVSTVVSAQVNTDYTTDYSILPFIGGVVCFAVLIVWIIFIAIAIWIYKDAEKRGKSGALWLILVIITGIIGIIIWFIVRPPIGGEPGQARTAGSDRRCPNCGRTIPMDARACPYCANKFDES